LAGSAPSKSSEKRSSFFFAIGPAGIMGKSAAKAAVVMSNGRARKMRMFIDDGSDYPLTPKDPKPVADFAVGKTN
jgi:hypothetical protein